MIEAQGRVYCHTRQHIHPININTPMSSLRSHVHQYSPITGLSMHQVNPIARQSFRTQPWRDDLSQQDAVKITKHSSIPTLQWPATPSHHPATHCSASSCPPSTSHIPTPHHNPSPRPSTAPITPFLDPSTILLLP